MHADRLGRSAPGRARRGREPLRSASGTLGARRDVVFTQQRSSMKSYRLLQKGPHSPKTRDLAGARFHTRENHPRKDAQEVVEGMLGFPRHLQRHGRHRREKPPQRSRNRSSSPSRRRAHLPVSSRPRASTRCWWASLPRPQPATCSRPSPAPGWSSSHRARPDAAGLARVDPHRGGAGVREVRGPAASGGSVWRIELTSPRWPD